MSFNRELRAAVAGANGGTIVHQLNVAAGGGANLTLEAYTEDVKGGKNLKTADN